MPWMASTISLTMAMNFTTTTTILPATSIFLGKALFFNTLTGHQLLLAKPSLPAGF